MVDADDKYLAHASSDDSDNESGYDSEAAEISKTSRQVTGGNRAPKRRKLSHSSASENDSDNQSRQEQHERRINGQSSIRKQQNLSSSDRGSENEAPSNGTTTAALQQDTRRTQSPISTASTAAAAAPLPVIHNGPDISNTSSSTKAAPGKPNTKPKSKAQKPSRPGVIYLSSLPPYLRPSALRNLLSQRGFSPISRLFLTPASKSKSQAPTSTTSNNNSNSNKTSRKLYTEGWLEFTSHKTAKLCAQTLNATPIGGKKGGYYRDDLWNMRYLRGMAWGELMAGVQGERREEEAKRDEERREIAREQKRFVEGVEMGRRWEGLEKGRLKKEKKMKNQNQNKNKEKDNSRDGEFGEDGTPPPADGNGDGDGDATKPQWTWRQFEVKKGGIGNTYSDGDSALGDHKRVKMEVDDEVSREAREVLGKIF